MKSEIHEQETNNGTIAAPFFQTTSTTSITLGKTHPPLTFVLCIGRVKILHALPKTLLDGIIIIISSHPVRKAIDTQLFCDKCSSAVAF
jgi:hypothetical protein